MSLTISISLITLTGSRFPAQQAYMGFPSIHPPYCILTWYSKTFLSQSKPWSSSSVHEVWGLAWTNQFVLGVTQGQKSFTNSKQVRNSEKLAKTDSSDCKDSTAAEKVWWMQQLE